MVKDNPRETLADFLSRSPKFVNASLTSNVCCFWHWPYSICLHHPASLVIAASSPATGLLLPARSADHRSCCRSHICLVARKSACLHQSHLFVWCSDLSVLSSCFLYGSSPNFPSKSGRWCGLSGLWCCRWRHPWSLESSLLDR